MKLSIEATLPSNCQNAKGIADLLEAMAKRFRNRAYKDSLQKTVFSGWSGDVSDISGSVKIGTCRVR